LGRWTALARGTFVAVAGAEEEEGGFAGQPEGGAVAPHDVQTLLVEVVEPLLLFLWV
jgi:hypothetical protein